MKSAFLAVFLLGAALTSARADEMPPDIIELVERLVKLEIEDFPPHEVPAFLSADPTGLPEKLRVPYKSKRLELYTLHHLQNKGKLGFVRMPEADCSVPEESQSGEAEVLLQAGYFEIEETEENFLIKRTKCTEKDLMCEFSLRIIAEDAEEPKVPKAKKKKKKRSKNKEKKAKKKPKRRLFLHATDPLAALVETYRQRGSSGQTDFFGSRAPGCAPRLK